MNRVKELRKANHLTQEKLAQKLRIGQTAISQWETGRTSPDPEIAKEIAALFGVTMEYVLGYTDKPSPGNWIPVYGRVAAGIPVEATEDIIDQEELAPDAVTAWSRASGKATS